MSFSFNSYFHISFFSILFQFPSCFIALTNLAQCMSPIECLLMLLSLSVLCQFESPSSAAPWSHAYHVFQIHIYLERKDYEMEGENERTREMDWPYHNCCSWDGFILPCAHPHVVDYIYRPCFCLSWFLLRESIKNPHF